MVPKFSNPSASNNPNEIDKNKIQGKGVRSAENQKEIKLKPQKEKKGRKSESGRGGLNKQEEEVFNDKLMQKGRSLKECAQMIIVRREEVVSRTRG